MTTKNQNEAYIQLYALSVQLGASIYISSHDFCALFLSKSPFIIDLLKL